ncbi:MAG: ABC transporter ATP-binding protein, partial [Xanthomonadales bacterium]|nr:ABC transporter ATP-binding protein [Xanthomonadales bacterium]
MTAIIEVERVHKRFGGLRAVDDCTLAVRAGSVTGLIGPN